MVPGTQPNGWRCQECAQLCAPPSHVFDVAAFPQDIAGIVAIMQQKHHSQKDVVAERGCGALANLAKGNQTNREAIRDAGGIVAVVACLAALGKTHEKVAEKGCWALWILAAGNQTNQDAIRDAGGVAVVKASKVNTHRHRDPLLKMLDSSRKRKRKRTSSSSSSSHKKLKN